MNSKYYYFFLLILFFCGFNSSQAQDLNNNCIIAVEHIYDKIISSIGNNFPAPPQLEISDSKRAVAFLSSNKIVIETHAINIFCEKSNFEDKIAYVISHELAHHYLNHTWMRNSGLGYVSKIGEFVDEQSSTLEQRKLSETQADLFGGFFGQIAGYNVLGFGAEALQEIYQVYDLPNEIRGYPSFDERIEIINSRKSEANSLTKLFHIGNVLLMLGDYDNAKKCYEDILLNNFTSREIYNNLGLVFLLKAISLSEIDISKYVYPVSIETQTRANTSISRSGDLFASIEELFNQASNYFKKSISLDNDYKKALSNISIIGFIKSLKTNSTNKFFKSDDFNKLGEEIKVDLKVINDLYNNKKIFKTKKKYEGLGSYVSKINLKKSNDCVDYENPFDVLNINESDIFLGLSRPYVKIQTSYGKTKLIYKKYDYFEIYEINNNYILKHNKPNCFKKTVLYNDHYFTILL